MEFDSKKWDAYVQEQGGNEFLAKKAMENKVINCCYLYDDAFDVFNGYEFDPLENTRHIGLFMALDLDITDFILPEPIQTVTGIEALRALCDGKRLKPIGYKFYYYLNKFGKIKCVTPNEKEGSFSDVTINQFMVDKFEVCDAESD